MRHRPPPDDDVAAQQARGLPRGGAVDRLEQLQLDPAAAVLGGHPAGQRARAVAQLDGVDLPGRSVQPRPAQRDRRRRERLARAGHDAVRTHVGGEHVERLRRGDAEALALADREVVRAAVQREHGAVAVDDLAGAVVEAGVAGQERGLAGAGQEAQVLRLGLGGHGQPGLGGQRAHLRLGQLPEREAQPRERRGRDGREHVGLVLGLVGGGAQQPVVRHPRVVARGQIGRAEPVGERDHRVEAHVAVAADARVRRHAVRVARQERVDHAGPERLAQVEREVRHAHPVRDRARHAHGVRGAAGGLGVVLGVRPQLERDRDGALPREQRRRPRSRPRRSSRRACGRDRARARPARARRGRARRAARRRPGRRRGTCRARARPAPRRSRARRPARRRAAARPRRA